MLDTKLAPLLKILGITSVSEQSLAQAFVHRSYLNEHLSLSYESNERLEFLGDSVLSLILSSYLYQLIPNENEGYLTTIRSATVSKTTLAKIALDLSLGDYLYLAKGEEESGGRKNPSILADTLEAFFGALFLATGIEETSNVILRLLSPKVEEIIKTGNYHDFKSLLQEEVQNIGFGSPVYKVLNATGPDHAKQFEVGVYINGKLVGIGTGRSKQAAQQEAAEKGLSQFKSPQV